MPKVTLIDFTGKGRADETWHAADLLLFTKGTRLELTPSGLNDTENLSSDEKVLGIKEMAKTIPSSWEFVDIVFLIEGVTRACAQQITRTRTGSYSMQSQRAVDVSDAAVTNPFVTETDYGDSWVRTPEEHQLAGAFGVAARQSLEQYKNLINHGASPQDARGILPMNIQCNLLAKYNLRSFVDLVRSRSSLRAQDEYAQIVRDELQCVLNAWPWASVFFEDPADVALKELEDVARELNVTPGSGLGWRIAKAIDLLRKGR